MIDSGENTGIVLLGACRKILVQAICPARHRPGAGRSGSRREDAHDFGARHRDRCRAGRREAQCPADEDRWDTGDREVGRARAATGGSGTDPAGSPGNHQSRKKSRPVSKRVCIDRFLSLECPPSGQNNTFAGVFQNRCAVIREKTRPSKNRPFKLGLFCQTGHFTRSWFSSTVEPPAFAGAGPDGHILVGEWGSPT